MSKVTARRSHPTKAGNLLLSKIKNDSQGLGSVTCSSMVPERKMSADGKGG